MTKKISTTLLFILFSTSFYSCTTIDNTTTKSDKGVEKAYWDKNTVNKDIQQVPELLLKFGSKNPSDWNYGYVQLKSIGEEIITKDMMKLVEQTKSDDPEVARNARDMLYKEGKFKVLTSKLKSTNPADWKRARFEAKSVSKEFYESFIITMILIFKYNSPERWNIAQNELISMGEEALPYLLQSIEHEFLKNKKDIVFLDNVSKTIVMLGDCALSAIRKSVSSDSTDVALSFLKSMRYSSNRKILDILIDVIQNSKKWEYKTQAIESIGHFNYKNEDDKKYAVKVVQPYIREREEFIKMKAVESLGNIKSGTAIVPLIEILRSNEKWYVKMAAARSLREIIRLPAHIKPGLDPELWSKYATTYYD